LVRESGYPLYWVESGKKMDMAHQFESPYLSITGAAKHLGITLGSLIMKIKKGELPPMVKVGNRMLFERDDLER
jgi:excisionase family DNA binding protein